MSAKNMTTNGVSEMAQAISVSDARTFLAMSAKELEQLHRNAPEPAADMLSGPLSGHYLTLHTDKQPFTDGICRFFTRFPGVRWAGKSFYPAGDNQGRGKNIISILGGLFRFELISFKTRVAESKVDSRVAFHIEYPAVFGRYRIVDELREVSPGVFLGRGCVVKRGETVKTLLWFALLSAK